MIFSKEYKIILKESFGPIKLGMRIQQVSNLLFEKHDKKNNKCYYFDNIVYVEYKNDLVVFIELSRNDKILPIFENMNLFKLRDNDILELFSSVGSIDKSDPEYGNVYSFDDLQINFWRETNPVDLQNELNDLDKNSEDYENEKNFYISEIEKYSYFQTIAIYDKNYYR
jgi:hypothetical protein